MAVNLCFCVKLSPNKKSIFGLRMGYRMLCFVFFVGIFASAAAEPEASCASVRSYFQSKGVLSAADILNKPNSDAGGLCGNLGCCAPGSRSRLVQQAQTQLEAALKAELGKLAEILATRAKRFDEFFRKLLKLSRAEFHAMFQRTYGMIYEQHSYVFQQLFEQLERYYTSGDADFDVMMDGFFSILYQKMFIVLNQQYTFDEKYLKCLSEHMRVIQPFEDVPLKLSVQLRRAFVATRTFHKALRSGADVVRNMMQVEVGQECVEAWARMRFCGACGGVTQPACSRYCHNVLRGCLPAHADLADQWDAYVDAVEKVADRLLGPFNIAMVVEPIDIKISEAIMTFQERNQDISQKIFADCGKPVLGGGAPSGTFFTPDRARRFARAIPEFDWNEKPNDVDDFEIEASFESLVDDPSLRGLRTPEGIRKATEEMAAQARSRERFLQYMRGRIDLAQLEEHERSRRDAAPGAEPAGAELDFKAYEFDGKRGPKRKKPTSTKVDENTHGGESGPALERLVRETRARVRASRRYWAHLPAALCTPLSVTAPPCFNGTRQASYTAIAAGDGSAALASNPEVRASVVAGAGVARTQQETLRTLTAKLKDAYNGVEVQWKDTAEELAVAASYNDFVDGGSGSGSGDDADDDDTGDLPDDDEDRDTGFDYAEGSGDHRITPEVSRPEEATPAPAASEPPFVPAVGGAPNTNNVQVRVLFEPPDASDPAGAVPDVPAPDAAVPDRPSDQPVAAGATEPSLQKALLTYALPVVCAWFGTIVTDLF